MTMANAQIFLYLDYAADDYDGQDDDDIYVARIDILAEFGFIVTIIPSYI